MLMYEVSGLKSPIWRLKSSFSLSPNAHNYSSPLHHLTDPGGFLPPSTSLTHTCSSALTSSFTPTTRSSSLSPFSTSSPIVKRTGSTQAEFQSSSFVHLFATKALSPPPLEEQSDEEIER